ncbi:MAG: 1-deoxy-D-xylulose-5-phosphate synthase [Armatimonadota bacterium]
MKSRIMYIELKTHPGGHNDAGPARIGRVTFSKTGSTLYYQGRSLQRGRPGSCGNYFDTDTGDVYWISGPKKSGEDRYPWAHRTPVEIDEEVREEYWTTIRNQPEKKNQATT